MQTDQTKLNKNLKNYAHDGKTRQLVVEQLDEDRKTDCYCSE